MTDTNIDAKRKIAADCFKKGSQALESQSWDYAIEMLKTSVKMVPENLFYRQTLRGAEKRKYDDNKKGKRLAGLSITKLKTQIKGKRMRSDWAAMDQLAEDGLALNPWDSSLNASLGEAAAKRGYEDVAEFAYRQALEMDSNSRDLLVGLADVYEERGKFNEAAEIWNKIQRLNPLDSEARMKANQLSADSTMDRGGYNKAENTQDVKQPNAYDVDRPVKQQIPEQVSGPGEDEEADFRRAIRKNPEDRQAYLKLTGFLREQKRYIDAYNELKGVADKFEEDTVFKEISEDVELESRMEEIELSRNAVEANKDDRKLVKRLQTLQKEYVLREIEILKGRISQNPKDLGLKFRLAKRYMKFKKWSEAIPLLQQASTDQRHQAEILVHLGKCYHADGRKELALRQFEKALPLIDQHERPQMFVEAHYFCGRMCEDASKYELAENHYLEVLGVDYDYKDARERLDKLSGMEDKSESE
ncbi:cellulose synthase subunit BcsC [Polystyrenella longa]|uniref:Cellulose synthase subunit BcsC n=1 Tax=Polystyrenella longa TaxID=2528007 RepID=A0A518CI00_9PLAN|nr:tetratricopeptide repeat protein [Polystyrenella longa]QDU78841.1 cellulose synthase subunit BcsC [Polystyrenella longa]